MKRLVMTTAMCLSAASQLMAQNNIAGKVVDDKGEPLAYANVVLLNRQDSAFVKGTVSNEDGNFVIDSSCNNGIIKVTSIGYKTVFQDCHGEETCIIQLSEDTKMLGEVVVKSSLPKTVLKNGGMTTTVAGSILEKAGTMENLLDRIPNVSAQNGSIKVFGRGEPIIYINGREMRDKSELDRLHSDNIKSVEVITNPGARYAASTKSVIRITTKKIQGEGFGFEATTEGEYDEKKNFGGYGRLNMNYRKNGLDLSLYSFGKKGYLPDNKDIQQYTYLDKTWLQKSEIRQVSKTITVNKRLEANYQLDENNSMGINFGFLRNPKQTWDGNMASDILQDEAYSENLNSFTHELRQKTNLSSNLYYVGKVGKLGIDFNADWFWSKEYMGNHTEENYKQKWQYTEEEKANKDYGFITGAQGQHIVNSNTNKYNRLYATKLVLSHPLWNGELSFGGEYSFTNRNSLYTIVPTYLADDDNSRIKEGMASAFITYNHDFGKLNVEAGLRYENVNFKYYDDGQYMAEQSKTYDNWFPSLTLSMPVGKAEMQLSYAADINRPSYWALRSGIQYDDRYTYETGNPFLVSEIARNLSYDLSYQWLTFNFTYTHTSDPIYQTVEIYKDNTAIGLMKMKNGDSYDNISSSLTLQPTIGIWHPSFSAMIEKQWFKMETRDGNYLDKPLAMLRFDNTLDTKLAMFSVMMTYITKGNERNMYIYKPMFNTDLSVSKSILKDQLSFQLYVSDLFGTNDMHTIGKYGKLKEMIYDEYSISKISLTIRYKFNTTRSKYKGTGAGQEQKERM